MNWMQEELEKIEKEKSEKEFLKLQKGENTVEFFIDPPTEVMYYGRKQKIFRVNDQGKKMYFGVSVKNPIYKQIILNLMEGKTVLRILKSGEKENTRFEVISGEKKKE